MKRVLWVPAGPIADNEIKVIDLETQGLEDLDDYLKVYRTMMGRLTEEEAWGMEVMVAGLQSVSMLLDEEAWLKNKEENLYASYMLYPGRIWNDVMLFKVSIDPTAEERTHTICDNDWDNVITALQARAASRDGS